MPHQWSYLFPVVVNTIIVLLYDLIRERRTYQGHNISSHDVRCFEILQKIRLIHPLSLGMFLQIVGITPICVVLITPILIFLTGT